MKNFFKDDDTEVVTTIRAGKPGAKKLQKKYPELVKLRRYKNKRTGETVTTIEIPIKK